MLSQYLTAIQCAGSLPPQETGLTCNSWYGKYHLEMHWWHAAHFPMWGRAHLLERSLGWYNAILPSAREKAKQQGYTGARWPKMTAPDGRSSPSPVGEMLIWQQPHPDRHGRALLCGASRSGDAGALSRRGDGVGGVHGVVRATTRSRGDRYVLGPPVIPAQENHPPRETWNPTFELEYWYDALGIAQQMAQTAGTGAGSEVGGRAREALGASGEGRRLPGARELSADVHRAQSRSSVDAGRVGRVAGEKVDREIMRATLKRVFATGNGRTPGAGTSRWSR